MSRWICSLFLRRIKVGSLVIAEGERRRTYGAGAPTATVHVRSPRAWKMLLRGSRGLAEGMRAAAGTLRTSSR